MLNRIVIMSSNVPVLDDSSFGIDGINHFVFESTFERDVAVNEQAQPKRLFSQEIRQLIDLYEV